MDAMDDMDELLHLLVMSAAGFNGRFFRLVEMFFFGHGVIFMIVMCDVI